MKTNKIVAYVRVSTEKQSCDMQKQSISDFLKSRGITEYETYQDDAESGTSNSRPALNMLLNDIKQGKVETLVVYRLDRLFRSLKHLIDSITLFKQHNVKFVSISENMDLTTAQGVFGFQILGAVAEFERNLISQRTKDGLAKIVAKGRKLGAPPKVYGSTKMKIKELRESRKSIREIAKETFVSYSTVRYILKTYGMK